MFVPVKVYFGFLGSEKACLESSFSRFRSFLFYFRLKATTSLRQVKEELFALGEIASQIKREGEHTKMCRGTDKIEDDVMIIDDDVCSGAKTQEDSTKQELNKVKGKLLQFHENYRPAYFGSWRKKSSSVGPRRPFKKDEVNVFRF